MSSNTFIDVLTSDIRSDFNYSMVVLDDTRADWQYFDNVLSEATGPLELMLARSKIHSNKHDSFMRTIRASTTRS